MRVGSVAFSALGAGAVGAAGHGLVRIAASALSRPYEATDVLSALGWGFAAGVVVLAPIQVVAARDRPGNACLPLGAALRSRGWPAWAFLALFVAILVTVALPGWISSRLVHVVRQYPATTQGRVVDGTVVTTTRTRGKRVVGGGTRTEFAFAFDVPSGPRAGTYHGRGTAPGALELGSEVPVRYDPDQPRDNASTAATGLGAWAASAALLLALGVWTAVLLAVLPGARRLDVLVLCLALVLPAACGGALAGQFSFEAL